MTKEPSQKRGRLFWLSDVEIVVAAAVIVVGAEVAGVLHVAIVLILILQHVRRMWTGRLAGSTAPLSAAKPSQARSDAERVSGATKQAANRIGHQNATGDTSRSSKSALEEPSAAALLLVGRATTGPRPTRGRAGIGLLATIGLTITRRAAFWSTAPT